MSIHPTAIVDHSAVIAPSAEIGPYAVIGENVHIGPNCQVGPHAVLKHCRIGAGTRVGSHSLIGGDPQMSAWKPVPSLVDIGEDCWIHEQVSIHRSKEENGVTQIGDRCMIMTNTHIGHDCILANDVTITTMTGLAGHVEVEEKAMIGGCTGIHQFVRIGTYAMVGAMSKPVKDIPPFMLADGVPATLSGVNSVGMKRAGFSPAARNAVKDAYRIICFEGLAKESRMARLRELEDADGVIARIIEFAEKSKRGIETTAPGQ